MIHVILDMVGVFSFGALLRILWGFYRGEWK